MQNATMLACFDSVLFELLAKRQQGTFVNTKMLPAVLASIGDVTASQASRLNSADCACTHLDACLGIEDTGCMSVVSEQAPFMRMCPCAQTRCIGQHC